MEDCCASSFPSLTIRRNSIVKDRTKGATTRVILGPAGGAAQPCAICGQPATVEVAWGKAY